MERKSSRSLKDLITSYLNSAKERLKSAQQLLAITNYRDSISRAYYAFLDAADAILLTKDVRPKSHVGTINQFSLHFVKPGIIEEKYIRWFKRVERARQEADYERETMFTEEDAKEALKKAEEFVGKIEEIVKRLKTEG